MTSMTNIPAEVFHPGDFLRDELEARDWTQEKFADILGRPIQAINQILQGTKQITADTAVAISQALGTSPELWLNLENAYQLSLVKPKEDVARRIRIMELYPYRKAAHLGWVADTKVVAEQEAEVCRVLRLNKISEEPKLNLAARGSVACGEKLSPKQRAWAFHCLALAEMTEVPQFDKNIFTSLLSELPKLSNMKEGLRLAWKKLRAAGIRLIQAPTISGSKIDGAMFWLDEKSPVVALSIRLDWVDSVWFTFMHELAHVHQGYRLVGRLDTDVMSNSKSEKLPPGERDANNKASRWLISKKRFSEFSKRRQFHKKPIQAFADELEIHASIVLGRLKFEEFLRYDSILNKQINEKATIFYEFNRDKENDLQTPTATR